MSGFAKWKFLIRFKKWLDTISLKNSCFGMSQVCFQMNSENMKWVNLGEMSFKCPLHAANEYVMTSDEYGNQLDPPRGCQVSFRHVRIVLLICENLRISHDSPFWKTSGQTKWDFMNQTNHFWSNQLLSGCQVNFWYCQVQMWQVNVTWQCDTMQSNLFPICRISSANHCECLESRIRIILLVW